MRKQKVSEDASLEKAMWIANQAQENVLNLIGRCKSKPQ